MRRRRGALDARLRGHDNSVNPQEFIEVTRQGIYVLLIMAAPPLLVSLAVGLVISLFQALTQIQEATLTFVPKIVALMLTLVVALPFMVSTLSDYTEHLMQRIEHIENE